ncbi:N-acetylglucosaminyl-diphospho-decaprenol L-rhamnosyltransferase [Rubrobacter xylanophilus DSM 9941]|uniref:glycosyltransferase family 2 protein n=1 Tax=Rubrobacter xylanophilus TaxID=49319 RepID=UPI001C640F4C|nr:glycosyltransferase [Rubrobacter xylanophilus]QYJ16703.1 N-acetylglucosaminyl-diphospho-decaprenol L-rhamnosyltransferase [Rubrobacter xylanophilus DSM 9941]
MTFDGRVSVVVATRDRRDELLRTVYHLLTLPERPHVVAVDNASSDGTPEALSRLFPEVEVVALSENLAAAGRTVGVRLCSTPYVAFADDDSWWEPGSLRRAADLLDAHPRTGLLAGRVLLGPAGREDPVCRLMAGSPLPAGEGLPGPAVLGFVACAAVVRREAYLEVGGFERRLFWGEEELLAADMAAAGWGLCYVPELVVRHHPSPVRDVRANRRRAVRNALLTSWLRRPAPVALRRSLQALRSSLRDPDARAGLAAALAGLPWALRGRRPLPPPVEAGFRLLEAER